jgi:hypothetical protein
VLYFNVLISVVNGRLCCLGSGQHLKHRFGNGFEVNIRTSLPAAELVLSLARRLADHHAIAPTGSAVRDNPISSFLVNSVANGEVLSMILVCLLIVSPDEVESGLHVERLEGQLIRPADVRNICVALSNPAREASIAPFKSGALLREMLDADGSVTVRGFLEWWVAEDCADALQRFMTVEFQGRAALLERSTSQNFRFRIRLQDDESPTEKGPGAAAASQTHSALSEVFAKFEANKAALCVQEYSVGQTTLEQIFNQFAAHQDNPEVAAILLASSSSDPRLSGSRNSRNSSLA